MKYLRIIFINLYSSFLAQDTLTFEKFFNHIIQNHPLIQNALLSTQATYRAYLLKSRGNFDPKINYHLQSKQFDGKNYFEFYETEIKIPTYVGMDIYTGYNYTSGLYLDNQNKIPPAGLYNLGISIPVFRNLFYDERRYNLQYARLLNKNSNIFFNTQVLKTLEPILDDYWNFLEQYNIMMLYRELVNTSYQRYINILNSAKTGEIPMIDTLDAGNQYQKFYLDYQKSILNFQNARYKLIPHLYPINDTNFVAPTIPQNITFDNIDTTHLIQQNPDLLAYQVKIKQLNIERKLKQEFLKPQLNIKYNFLLHPFSNEYYYPLNTNNYKWGIDFSFPLFLRKERAELKLVNLKINQTKNELIFKQNQIQNKIKIYYNNYLNYYQQLQYALHLNQRYYQMLQAEIKNFQAGESNLFTVNTREIYYLQSKITVIELYQKYNYYKNWLSILQKYSNTSVN
ncbi:MAG: TolC family protein [Bacteroidetes bacterium]|nr:MAG: TolC family protein [Bacteroidota bacterium]